jgi:hypothetical protein
MPEELEAAESEEIMVVLDPEDLDPNDLNHPRWLHPIVPEGGGMGPVEVELARHALQPIWVGERMVQYMVRGRTYYVPRYPAKDGLYGFATAPQYAMRRDHARHTLEAIVTMFLRLC